MSELFRLEKLCKAFPGVKALNDVSFSIEKGEVLALMGENGAGKSTLIKILAGAYRMDSGEIFCEGKKVQINDRNDSTKLGISIIFQELNLFSGSAEKPVLYMTEKKQTVKQNCCLKESASIVHLTQSLENCLFRKGRWLK